MKKKVYISGKISGLPRDEYMKMFGIAEQMLREKGYKVVNPTRFFLSRHYQRFCRLIGHQNAYDLTLLYDLWRLMRCDLIYKIPGWKQSRGANIESCVAYHFKVRPMLKDAVQKIDNRLEKIIKASEKVVLLALCAILGSCTTTKVVTVEKVRTDTLRENRIERDSIWLHDSIHIREKGDTVLIERWHIKWQNHLEHDTVYKSRTDSVPVPYPVEKLVAKPLSKIQKGLMWIGGFSLVITLLFLIIKLKLH